MIDKARMLLKFKKLVRWIRSQIPDLPVDHETVAVGLLERLWHCAMRNTPRGDIGRLDDVDIAWEVGWHGDERMLVSALVEFGWLDADAVHRLVVHDWENHCPKHIKGGVNASGGFVATQPIATQPIATQPIATQPIAPPTPDQTRPDQTEPDQTGPSAPKPKPASTQASAKRFFRGDSDLPDSFPAGLRQAAVEWFASKPKRTDQGFAKAITRMANVAAERGVPAVIEAIDKAMANDWKGWEHFDDSGAKPNGGYPKSQAQRSDEAAERFLARFDEPERKELPR